MKQQYQAFVFDLDGTLAESKSPITPEVSAFLQALLQKGKTVGIITGGTMAQLKEQFLKNFTCEQSLWNNLYLMPTSGAIMYRWQDNNWHEVYAHRLPAGEYERICQAFDTIFTHTTFPRPEAKWGNQLENRDTQVTFSALGQEAPPDEKKKWATQEDGMAKKQEMVALLTPLLPEYAVKAGGATSVDITLKGIDKQFGVEQFLQQSGCNVGDTLFTGDAIYEGGNDFVVGKTGVDMCSVTGPTDLLQKLNTFVI